MPVDGHPWRSTEERGAPECVGARRVRPDPLDGSVEVSNLEGTDRRLTKVKWKLAGDAIEDRVIEDLLPRSVDCGPMSGVDAVL